MENSIPNNQDVEKTLKTEETVAAKPEETTRKLVGIRFSSAGKIFSFETSGFNISLHELIVVEGEKGPITGRVAIPPYEIKSDQVATNIKKVLRKAEPEDIEKYETNKEEAMNAFKECQKKISEHGLLMKLVDVDILKGDGKAVFYFTAEERVDFRSLVKDLATTMHMRIEMRQIGARDAAKSIGSIGSCGYICCCEQHLNEFKSIAIQMAKNQGLSPNPAKLTGMCGKLKCCLQYENDMYTELKANLPEAGSEVDTPKGKGRINSVDVPRRLIFVHLEESGDEMRFTETDIKVIRKRERKKPNKQES